MAASAEPVCRANASELMASVCRTARRLFSPPERCAFPADPTNSRVLEAWWTRVVYEPRASSVLLPNTLELLRAFLSMNAPVFLLRFVRFFTAPLRAFASQFVGRYLSLQKLIHQTELFVPENRNV